MYQAGKPTKYPWDLWFNGEPHLLDPTKDFPDTSVKSFLVLIARRATEHRVVFRHSVRQYPGYLLIRAWPWCHGDDIPYGWQTQCPF